MKFEVKVGDNEQKQQTFNGEQIKNRNGLYRCIDGQGDNWNGKSIIWINNNLKLLIRNVDNNICMPIRDDLGWFTKIMKYVEMESPVTITITP